MTEGAGRSAHVEKPLNGQESPASVEGLYKGLSFCKCPCMLASFIHVFPVGKSF